MPKLIIPTVGRQVWFYERKEDEDAHKQPMAATVCYVHDYRTVNLQVLDHDGCSFIANNCPLMQEKDVPPPNRQYSQWMPYQLAKAEEAE